MDKWTSVVQQSWISTCSWTSFQLLTDSKLASNSYYKLPTWEKRKKSAQWNFLCDNQKAWSRSRSRRSEAQQSAHAVMHESEGGSVEDFIHCPTLLSSALLPWRAWRMRFGVPGSLSVFSCSAAAEPHPFSWPAEQLLISLSSPQSLVRIRHRLEWVPDQREKPQLWDLIILKK